MGNIASPQDFKKKSRTTLALPSGLIVRVKKMDSLKLLMSEGEIPNNLIKYVNLAIQDGVVNEKDLAEELDLGDLQQIQQLMDRITIECWVEPRIYPVPDDEANRIDDQLYIDEVDLEDKMFVFQWVMGGDADVERFRQEHQATMDTMGSISKMASAAPRDSDVGSK